MERSEAARNVIGKLIIYRLAEAAAKGMTYKKYFVSASTGIEALSKGRDREEIKKIEDADLHGFKTRPV